MDNDVSVDLPQGQIVSLPKGPDSDNSHLLDEREQIDTRLSNQDLILEKERMSDVAIEVLQSIDVVREEGGARGRDVSGEEGACVEVAGLCEEI
jgi:hypothetical protein